MNKQDFADLGLLYVDNALQALRTAGALLMGNSALIYFGILGTNQNNFEKIVFLGLLLTLIGAWPFGAIGKLLRKGK